MSPLDFLSVPTIGEIIITIIIMDGWIDGFFDG